VKQLSDQLDTKSPERRVLYLLSELVEVADDMLDLLNAPINISDSEREAMKRRLGMEIYDVIWNTVDLANMLDIDLETAFAEKEAINAKRKWSRSGYLSEQTDDGE
ncbi:MAG: hypothetical protein AAFR67_06935, partial [Chloroflexota bacterium]